MDANKARELLANATQGDWYFEESSDTWQLFAEQRTPWPEGTPRDVLEIFPEGSPAHPMQLLKAPKGNTPYAEYWPKPSDAKLIAAAPRLARALIELDEVRYWRVLNRKNGKSFFVSDESVVTLILSAGCRTSEEFEKKYPEIFITGVPVDRYDSDVDVERVLRERLDYQK